MSVPASITILSSAPSADPLAGVSVQLFNPTTLAFAASAVTDADGKAAFLLDGGTYEARFFKMGISFAQPMNLIVDDPVVVPNDFFMFGTPVGDFGLSPNPRVCRCVGRFLNFSGYPVPNALLRVVAPADSVLKTPRVIDGDLVSVEAMNFHTDKDGWLALDLLRGGEYYITFSGESDAVWNIKVPELPTCNLIDLLHPQPVRVTWDMEGPFELMQDEKLLVTPTCLFSDGEALHEHLDKWLDFLNEDETKVEVLYSAPGGQLQLKGLAPGTSRITVAVKDGLFPRRVPNYVVTAASLDITVTAP